MINEIVIIVIANIVDWVHTQNHAKWYKYIASFRPNSNDLIYTPCVQKREMGLKAWEKFISDRLPVE